MTFELQYYHKKFLKTKSQYFLSKNHEIIKNMKYKKICIDIGHPTFALFFSKTSILRWKNHLFSKSQNVYALWPKYFSVCFLLNIFLKVTYFLCFIGKEYNKQSNLDQHLHLHVTREKKGSCKKLAFNKLRKLMPFLWCYYTYHTQINVNLALTM